MLHASVLAGQTIPGFCLYGRRVGWLRAAAEGELVGRERCAMRVSSANWCRKVRGRSSRVLALRCLP